ncbi:FIG01199972: hypothetical protein [hydrothermal vent metagenome]|uniref:DUF1538 domain-containing protein n=1 Tax=hydrothermal vent metagenome TaxID=652676 RepID=A0A3B0ZJX6_9ZZZZ
MDIIYSFIEVFISTIGDVLPIVSIIFATQYFIIRRPMDNLKQVVFGFVLVIFGMAFFLVGLEEALFPLGEVMAKQLTAPDFLGVDSIAEHIHWDSYIWVYVFAAAIGFATTLAEPALLAVAIKAQDVSGGTVSIWGLRTSVAIGVGLGISLGTFRIVTGTPLHYYIIAGYVIVLVQTIFAPKSIIALAYDSGGVTTSTVTVPLVAALGIGLAGTVPGRSELIDGFGLIAFASLFPMITVMGYAQIGHWRAKQSLKKKKLTGE